MTQYDDAFFAYVNSGALRSARRFLPALLQHLPPAGAPGLISSLTRHWDMANFSAASPW